MRRRPRTTQRRNKLHRTKGHIKQDRRKRIEPKGLDNQWPERRYPATRNRDGSQKSEPDPRLDVEETLLHVVPAPDAGGDAHLVHADSFNSEQFVVAAEEAGLHRRIG